MKKIKSRRIRAASESELKLTEPGASDTLRARRVEWLSMTLLLVLGIYLAIVYFGQKAVPNSDFTAFVEVGRQIAHFQAPSSFKRVPLLGLLQIVTANFIVNSPHPVFTAGLLVNAILYVLSILIFYRICRFVFEPTGAFCLSLVAALNPYTLAMLVDPIAETTLVFFILLTICLILKRSWWCYLAAMLASMTRYEGFALIGIAFLLDLLLRKSNRQRLIALGLCVLAATPTLFWLLGMKLQPSGPGGHYFRVLLNVEHRNGFELFKMLWHTSFSSLLQWPEWVSAALGQGVSSQAVEQITAQNASFQGVLSIATALFFLLGGVFIFIRKQWMLAGMLLFWLFYVFVHAMQSVLLDRYTVPAIWLTLFIAACGLKFTLDVGARHIGRSVLPWLLIPVILITGIWLLRLLPLITRTAAVSPASRTVVYAGGLVLISFFVGRIVIGLRLQWVRDLCVFLTVGLFIVSNQFSLAFRLGGGDTDIEFKQLALWYAANAAPEEKLVTTLPGVVQLFVPEEKRPQIIHTNAVGGQNLAEFAASCQRMRITYVAWDSRLGFAKNDYYYKDWGLKKIEPLGTGRNIGPFTRLQRFERSPNRFLYLYKIDSSPAP